jgi:predicted RNA-binding protein YlxR (DUF448 family)
MGCGNRDAKRSMMRIVCEAGTLRFDPTGHSAGRGGYLHDAQACWSGFATRKGMIRSLKAHVAREARAAFVERLREGVEQ